MVTNTRPSGKKWSQFTKQTTVSGTASINMEDGGKNVTIAVDDFASQYQLAELIVEGIGTPVLQIAGSQNKIRSIESSGGISVSVGATNNIELGLDLDNGSSGGAEIIVDTAASPIVARTIQALAGIQVSQVGDAIQIGTSALPAPVTTVIVNSEVDFPTQDATTITLDAGIQFILGASFTTAKNFIIGDKSLFTGGNILSPVLTYTGTAPMFTSVDASFTIRDIQIDHPNSEGFNFTDTVGGAVLFLNEKVRTVSGTKYGTFNDLQTVLIEGSSALDVDDGITLQGVNNLIFSTDKFYMGSTSPTFAGIDLTTSITQNLEFDDLIVIGPVGSVGIKGAASSGNVPVGTVATVSRGNFSGVDTPLDTIAVDDIRWEFAGNSGIPNTRRDALISTSSNLLETVITATLTPVKVNAVWVCEGESFFDCDTAGRMTYIGENQFRAPIDFSTTVKMAAGSSKQVTVFIAVNGTVVSQTGKEATVSAANPSSIATAWQHTFSTGDYVEVWVENDTDTNNIIMTQAVGRIN